MEENEVELMDYLNVIWKRKWLIIIPTLFCVILAGVISFLLPRKWEIDTLIMPSKFFVQTEEGKFEEVVFVDPEQIAGQINQKAYNSLIAAELNMSIGEIAKLKAENLPKTKLIRVFIREKDAEKAKLILHSLFTHIKRELDGNVDVEMKEIVTQIKSNEIEKLRIEKEIGAFKNKLNIVRQRKKEIEKEMNDIRKRVELLEKEQRLNLKKENRSEAESLAMLLYSNEIQESLRYHNTLNELLDNKKIELEDMNLEIENKEERIQQIENKVDNLNEKKRRINYTAFIKEPTSSLSPISPKKKLNIIIAGILGLMIFTMLAFFLEYIEKQKA